MQNSKRHCFNSYLFQLAFLVKALQSVHSLGQDWKECHIQYSKLFIPNSEFGSDSLPEYTPILKPSPKKGYFVGGRITSVELCAERYRDKRKALENFWCATTFRGFTKIFILVLPSLQGRFLTIWLQGIFSIYSFSLTILFSSSASTDM